ncbi:MAG TPA: M48 family metallopeptidase [Candidatus Doudnabacteria bacterium]|nr:M48 family metallopeptidase [Candidatus Doudnabacteria bacterium]
MNQSLALNLKKFNLTNKPLNLFRLEVLRLITDYTNELDVSCKQIKLKSLRSRWGSCTRAGVITINLKLKELPSELLDYVVYHECLHLIYHNHGVGFQARLRAKFPHARELNKDLKIFGTKLLKQKTA